MRASLVLAVLAVLAALGVLATGCIVPFGAPGTRLDGGYTLDHRLTGRVGAHLLSLRKEADARLDVGAGFALNNAVGGGMTGNGGYLDAAWTQQVDHATLVSVGPGLNLLDRGGAMVSAAYLRAGVEFFAGVDGSGTSDDRCGMAFGGALGRTAIGVYADVSRPLTGDGGFAMTAGLSVRLPAFGGFAIVIPGCK
jgi:hypothetical protein